MEYTYDAIDLFKEAKIVSSTSFRGPNQTVNQQNNMMRVVIDMPLRDWKRFRDRIEQSKIEATNYNI